MGLFGSGPVDFEAQIAEINASAERANMSLMTLRSLERGEAQVSMANYMAVIACLGFQDDVAQVAANDVLGRDLQDAAL